MPGGGGRGSFLTCAECGATLGVWHKYIGVIDLQYFGSNCDNCGDPANGNTEYCPCNLKLQWFFKEASFHWITHLFLPKWHFRQAYISLQACFGVVCSLHARNSNFSSPKHCFLPGKHAAEQYKITPRMHQKSPFWDTKSKIFRGRGHCPLPRPLPQWGKGHPSPHPTPSAPRLSVFFRYFRPCRIVACGTAISV